MTAALHTVEDQVLQRIAAANQIFLLLDYDGTLAAIAPTPAEAMPLPGTVDLLHELVALPGVQVAVVSGRPIADVRSVLAVPALYYIGVHGLEIRTPNGATEAAEGTAIIRSVLPAIKRQLLDTIGGRPGILLEDKGVALACHYRLAAPADAARAVQTVTDVVREYRCRGVPIALLSGHAVAEIHPAHASKGKAVCALLASHARTALPVYIGDDRTDEDAFRLLPAEAITIRVADSTEPTFARYRVQTPDDVQGFLRAVKATRLDRGVRTGAPAR